MCNICECDLVFYGLCLDVFWFDGLFFSFVMDLFFEVCYGLWMKYLVCVDLIIEVEKLIEIFVCLNIKYGFNIE